MHVLSVLTSLVVLLPTPVSARSDAAEIVTASRVLHAWDARREAAWAASDTRRLRHLYAPGSAAGRADVRLLRAYDDHGLVVRRIVTQVFSLRVLHLDGHRLRLWVVDRVAGGKVGSLGEDEVLSPRALGTTPPRARVIVFRRSGDDWRVVSVTVRAPPRGPPARRGP